MLLLGMIEPIGSFNERLMTEAFACQCFLRVKIGGVVVSLFAEEIGATALADAGLIVCAVVLC